VDGHQGLKSESFGFGQDRQMHIFKVGVCGKEHKCAQQLSAPNSVSIKNTFIDDWNTATAGDDNPEAAAFRSVPPKLSTKGVQLPCISSDCSTVASSPRPGSPTSSVASFQEKSLQTPFGPPPGLEIRNTFVHFGARLAAERAVQSMPHGMFGHRLAEEVYFSQDRVSRAAAVPADNGGYVYHVGAPLAKGTEVIIDGLVKCPAFNGLRVVVDSFDESTSRYNVLLTAPSAGHKSAKIKRQNLLLVSPSPASFIASLASEGGPNGEEWFLSTWQSTPI
jgi:hypothetical protein